MQFIKKKVTLIHLIYCYERGSVSNLATTQPFKKTLLASFI